MYTIYLSDYLNIYLSIYIALYIYLVIVTYAWLYAQKQLSLYLNTHDVHKQYLMGMDLKLFGELFENETHMFFEPRSPVQSFSSNRLAV